MSLHSKHDEFLEEVNEFLREKGFYVSSAAYHEVLNDEIQGRLSQLYDLTSLYLRSRSDQFAIHKYLKLCFEYDAKTHDSKRYSNITIESTQFIQHLHKSKLGVEFLYCYRDDHHEIECGFWINDHPKIEKGFIPDRWNESQFETYRSQIHQFIDPTLSVNRIPWRRGSGDPFIVIADIENLPHWKKLILDKMDFVERANQT